MASNRSKTLQRTNETGSEEYFRYTCSRCLRKQTVQAASHYCQTCDSYFCTSCLSLHDGFFGSDDHKMLDSSDMAAWGRTKDGDDCPEHSGNKLTIFCKVHGRTCCSVCVSLEHRACRAMVFIPKIAEGILQTRAFQSIVDDVESLKTKIEQLKKTKEDKRRGLEKCRKDFQTTIGQLRKKIRTTLDRLQEKATDEMERIFGEQDTVLLQGINHCGSVTMELEHEQDHLMEESDNESLVFIRLKSLQGKMEKYLKSYEDLSKVDAIGKFTFVVNKHLTDFIENIKTIGTFDESQDESSQCLITERKIRKPGMLKKQATPRPAEVNPKHTEKLTDKKKFNIRSKQDENECCIQGICQLGRGDIIISDYNNKTLKRLDSSYTIIDCYKLSCEPNAVCCMGGSKVAVGLDNRTLQFVRASSEMKKTKSIYLDHECYGLAYTADKLFMTEHGGNKLYVHDKVGAPLQIIEKGVGGEGLFACTYRICVGEEDGTPCVYIIDREKGLVVVDEYGNGVSEDHHQELSNPRSSCTDPRSVCTDSAGNVYVCGNLSHNIVQLGKRGNDVLKVVASRADGIWSPEFVHFDSMRSRLIVSSSESGHSDIINVIEIS